MYLNILVHCFSLRHGNFEKQVLFRHKCYLYNLCIHEDHILFESCASKQLLTVLLCKRLLIFILFRVFPVFLLQFIPWHIAKICWYMQ